MPGRYLPIAALLILTLGSCATVDKPSAEPPQPSATSTALYGSPDDRTVIEGTGYTFRIPDGWIDHTAGVKAQIPSVDRAVGQATASLGLASGVTVFKGPTKAVHGVAEEAQAARKLLSASTTDVKRLSNKKIDGRLAVNHVGKSSQGGQSVQIEQYYVLNGTAATTVWFTFTTQTAPADRQIIRSSVLKSWHWNKEKTKKSKKGKGARDKKG